MISIKFCNVKKIKIYEGNILDCFVDVTKQSSPTPERRSIIALRVQNSKNWLNFYISIYNLKNIRKKRANKQL